MTHTSGIPQADKPAPNSAEPLVAVVIDPSLPYDREIATGVAEYAREVGDWRLYMEEEQDRRLPDFDAWPGQGIIASFDTDRVARRVMAAGLPVVAVGGGGGAFDAASGIPYVETDNKGIAILAAEHLLERGLPHFGFYGLAPSRVAVWSEARREAFARRLRAAGKHVQALVPRHDSTRWSLLQDELKAWLAALPKPVGIMACDDVRARHVLEACRSLGLRVPHDVALIGVDDDAFVCEQYDPPLSSVAQGACRVGHEAARLLDRLMRPARSAVGKGPAGPVPLRTVFPPVGVVARQSTEMRAVVGPFSRAEIRTSRPVHAGGVGARPGVRSGGLPALSEQLSAREITVLKLMREGKSNIAIGRRLGIAESTVKSHITHMLLKLGATDRASAVARGFDLGLLAVSRDR